jgi:hypothetical protein
MNHKTSSYKHPVKENIDMEYLLPQKLSSGKVFSHIFTVLLALSVIENGLLSTGILSTTLPITQLPRKGYIPAVKDTYMRRSEASSSSCPISRKNCMSINTVLCGRRRDTNVPRPSDTCRTWWWRHRDPRRPCKGRGSRETGGAVGVSTIRTGAKIHQHHRLCRCRNRPVVITFG